MTATDINHAMGRLYSAVAQNRIPVRNANTLARIDSTLLRTVPGIKNEFKFSCSFDQWNKMLRKSEPLSGPDTSDLSPATPSIDSTADDAPSEEAAGPRRNYASKSSGLKTGRYETGTFDGAPGFCSGQPSGWWLLHKDRPRNCEEGTMYRTPTTARAIQDDRGYSESRTTSTVS